ncbi:hypothetical protein RHMOL_Rhmol11G0179300 [Rhododendron molle]|uniref:Uncharacterized protein n=1 Tax=Rhododendron molle TaxID=49168 RepID=A0ACC0LUK6_RHOML|nr:hypothetical protein RHMOL_Rhmol11G0179300 [Rhododendron molle]
MSVPVGYKFRPTDQELVIDYLRKKSKGAEALPCDVVLERDIYGTGNKAPWQIFTKNDLWEECSVYVLTKLIKARGSDKRIARTAGCGSWHGETGPEPIYDVQTDPEPIGYKRMLRFQITNESGAMDESVGKGYWTMHEFSLRPDGNSTSSTRKQSPKGEYVLCRIKRDGSRDTKIVKCTKKSTRKEENVEAAAATSDTDVIMVRKPAKHARKEEFEQEQKAEAPETTEVISYSQELLEAEKEGNYSQMLSDMDADLEELCPMLESEQLTSTGLEFDPLDPQTLSWLPPTPFSEEFSEAEEQVNYSQMFSDMVADCVELVPTFELEELPSFGLDFDALDPQIISGLPPTPFSKELLEVEKQGNYSQMLSDVDADLEELISILESEQLPNTEELVPMEELEQLPSYDLDSDALDALNEEYRIL